jgi:acyl-CoA dehydrogenase
MSESHALLIETADRLFADLASGGGSFEAAWPRLQDAGFPTLLVGEDEGGFGGDWQDAFAVLRLSAFHALPAPLAEAIVAGRAATVGALPPVEGLVTIAEAAASQRDGARFSGVLSGVAYAQEARWVLVEIDGRLARLAISDATSVERRHNPAGEPRARLRFDGATATLGAACGLRSMGALARTAQIAGGLDAALALSIAHANDRVQFGKPISKFQAVQQALAVFAEEAAAVNCAGQAAARALDLGDGDFEIAAAKLRAGLAAETGAAIAHQTHGAIGFTREHPLHRFTRPLISWRSEFGGDRDWARRLAAIACAAGPDGIWPLIAARSDAA